MTRQCLSSVAEWMSKPQSFNTSVMLLIVYPAMQPWPLARNYVNVPVIRANQSSPAKTKVTVETRFDVGEQVLCKSLRMTFYRF